MEKFFGTPKLAHSSSEDVTFGRFGGPSSAFMSWPTVKPFYDTSSSYLSLKTPEMKSDIDEKVGKSYTFKDIMDSGPPMTSVFMGLSKYLLGVETNCKFPSLILKLYVLKELFPFKEYNEINIYFLL
jgi:hypothetical protein